MPPRGWMPLLLLLLAGCGGASRVVRLDVGQERPLVFTPRTGAAAPVEVDGDTFEEGMAELARDVRPSARPQEVARRLFEVEARSGSYLFEPRSHRLRPLGPGEHLTAELPEAEVELTRAYLRWCERTSRPGDCLGLLVDGPTVTGDGRYALALALAQGAVLEEMREAFKDMADPQALLQAVLWTWTTYMVLLAVPEPFSKGLAAVMTATLISYVGVETFWSLLVGFQRLVDEADRATTFDALRAAGERYGRVMGRNAARAFALLATAALGHTAAGLGAKVPRLPGAAGAAAQAETQLGLQLGMVGEVRTVAVSAEAVTLSLAPGAVVMAGRGGGTLEAETPPEASDVAASVSWKGFSKGSLSTHYEKHVKVGGEFGGSISQREYLELAKAFASERAGRFQQRVVGNFVVKYDPRTRRVLVGHLKDRELRTFYEADGRDADPFTAAVRLAAELGAK